MLPCACSIQMKRLRDRRSHKLLKAPASRQQGQVTLRVGLSSLQGRCPSCHTLAASEINLRGGFLVIKQESHGAGRDIHFLIQALPPEPRRASPIPALAQVLRVATTAVTQVQGTLSSPGGFILTSPLCARLPKRLLDFCAPAHESPAWNRGWLGVVFSLVSVTYPSCVDSK